MKLLSLLLSLGVIVLPALAATDTVESKSVVEEVGVVTASISNTNTNADSDADTDAAYDKNTCKPGPHNKSNPFPEPDARAPDHFYFLIPTTVQEDTGWIIFEVNRTWAPLGVDRFYSLATDNYYDCAALFRVIRNFVVQWGIASSPDESAKWDTTITDDPVLLSNTVGTVSFATAGPGTRTTQIFVNTVDNLSLDSQGFAPFAKVVSGMNILTSTILNVPSPVPDQGLYQTKGNTWLLPKYPDIDIIKGKGSVLINDDDKMAKIKYNIH
mmetsp:Transcript_44616/g.49773  ORF Transcript_44616/g.49773 Transcript_44616/m.49773 type:complete len:270 (+) Transcript_44616:59-868(+)